MKRILVATDFSTRSDRALRRATILAKKSSAEIILLHVVDDDQPQRLVKLNETEAHAVLLELAEAMREADGVKCRVLVDTGDPFAVIAEVAKTLGVDIVVVGPHRRMTLRGLFAGTTVERTIRQIGHPIIVANGMPVRQYKRVVVATDLSECSAQALAAARKLGLFEGAEVFVLYAFATQLSRNLRVAMTTQQLKAYLLEEEEEAQIELDKFLHNADFSSAKPLLKRMDVVIAQVVLESAKEQKADLVVIGTHGRSGFDRFFLGSVAEEVLRDAEIDVLAVPPVRGTVASESQ